jgi:hypothetical protein
MKIVVEELQKKNAAPPLTDLRKKILECHETEEKAFRRQNDVIR